MKHGGKIVVALIIATMIMTAIFLAILPDTVPVHYNLAGEVNRMGSKYEYLIFPAFSLLTGPLMLLASKKLTKDPAEKKALVIVAIILTAMYGIMGGYFMGRIAASATPVSLEGSFWPMGLLIGLPIIILGFAMPRLKPNSFIGLRTPWTYSSENVWRRSHRFCGIAAIPTGTAIIILSFLLKGEACAPVILISCFIWLFLSTLASWIYFRQEVRNDKEK